MIYRCTNSECPQVEWEDLSSRTHAFGCPWCGTPAKHMMKTCKKCGTPRHTEREYYRSRPTVCKACVRENARAYYYENKEKFTAWRKNNPDKKAGYDRQRDKVKSNARAKLRYAVKTGKIVKPERCEICDRIKQLQGHHDDYTKPLDVKFLCRKCHMKLHRKDQ
jgi:hypothetical protein